MCNKKKEWIHRCECGHMYKIKFEVIEHGYK